jgi:hypothetical protein
MLCFVGETRSPWRRETGSSISTSESRIGLLTSRGRRASTGELVDATREEVIKRLVEASELVARCLASVRWFIFGLEKSDVTARDEKGDPMLPLEFRRFLPSPRLGPTPQPIAPISLLPPSPLLRLVWVGMFTGSSGVLLLRLMLMEPDRLSSAGLVELHGLLAGALGWLKGVPKCPLLDSSTLVWMKSMQSFTLAKTSSKRPGRVIGLVGLVGLEGSVGLVGLVGLLGLAGLVRLVRLVWSLPLSMKVVWRAPSHSIFWMRSMVFC